MSHLQQHTCHSLRVIVVVMGRSCLSVRWCETTAALDFFKCHGTGLENQSALLCKWAVSAERFTLEDTLGQPHPGGYAGVRLGEAQNLGQAEYERDCILEPSAHRTRINEAGDKDPGSQDSITRGVQNVQRGDVPPAQPVPQ